MLADLVLMNCRVITMNASRLHAEAIAVENDKIARVGTNEEITRWIGKNTKVIDLKGKTVVPGFIDTHIHVADFGRMLNWVDLRGVKSIKEMQCKIGNRAQRLPKGKWIIGHGWDHNIFEERRYPNLLDFDEASPDNPVILYHQFGRMCVVNRKALELAAVTRKTGDPSGGKIEKDAKTGEPTGILLENATDLVWKMIPEPSEEEIMKETRLACEAIVKAGVTSVHWIVSSLTETAIIQKLHAGNELPLRIYTIIPAGLLDNVSSPDIVKVGGVMIFADGFIAARTAALYEPYSDDTTTKGKLLCTQEEMNALAAKTHKANLQFIIHAMGDQAIDAALVAIEAASKEAPKGNRRYRLEQAALLNKRLIQRIKKQKIIVSIQPRVVNSEFSVWSAIDHLGLKRARWLYPLKTLLKEHILLIGGSDCPMEPLSPLLGIQSAVTRQFFPEERITVDEALRMYTFNAAYASFEEDIKGSIEEGKIADLTILSSDPRAIPANQIGNISVEMTIIGGKVIYPKSSS